MHEPAGFIPPHGNYRQLISDQKAEIIFDLTFRFCHRFLARNDRTVDQMIQAARSGKQNIAICLIHQANYLLNRQIRSLERTFTEHGGIRERMAKARQRKKRGD